MLGILLHEQCCSFQKQYSLNGGGGGGGGGGVGGQKINKKQLSKLNLEPHGLLCHLGIPVWLENLAGNLIWQIGGFVSNQPN